MKVNAKRLIMSFVIASPDQSLAVQNLVYACSLFGINDGTVRVNITRLVREGRIQPSGRGHYTLCSEYANFSDHILRWRTALDQIIPWNGDWATVSCGSVNRTDRKQKQSGERSLKLNGFQALEKSLYIRPNNLAGGVSAVRARLYDLGLDKRALVFNANELIFANDELATLWNVDELMKNYRSLSHELTKWLENISHLQLEKAATESFVYGENAIRLMVLDPLLPKQFIDAELRDECFDTLLKFDQKGRELWHSILES